MPRNKIELPDTIDYLSILNDQGQIDQTLAPALSTEDLMTIYRYMLLARRADERMLLMQRQGRLGTFPQSSGHEAISMGAAFAITGNDWMVPAYRELAAQLYRGWTLELSLLYWMGFEEGACVPEKVNDLPVCIPIASQLLHATGIGMAMNIKDEKQVVLTFFGDGASSEGDCHEAMNFASVFSAPVIFVCVNNQYAISVPISRQMKSKTIAQRAIAYGMPGICVDGNDVLAVYSAVKEAVERARQGKGPSLIEAITYRLTPHTTADDPKKYRLDSECEEWQDKEPLKRFKKYLETKNLLSKVQSDTLEEELSNQIKSAIQNAENFAKSENANDPLSMFDYLYQSLPEHLKDQKEELAEYLLWRGGAQNWKGSE